MCILESYAASKKVTLNIDGENLVLEKNNKTITIYYHKHAEIAYKLWAVNLFANEIGE